MDGEEERLKQTFWVHNWIMKGKMRAKGAKETAKKPINNDILLHLLTSFSTARCDKKKKNDVLVDWRYYRTMDKEQPFTSEISAARRSPKCASCACN